jgi:hypothetical protein
MNVHSVLCNTSPVVRCLVVAISKMSTRYQSQALAISVFGVTPHLQQQHIIISMQPASQPLLQLPPPTQIAAHLACARVQLPPTLSLQNTGGQQCDSCCCRVQRCHPSRKYRNIRPRSVLLPTNHMLPSRQHSMQLDPKNDRGRTHTKYHK